MNADIAVVYTSFTTKVQTGNRKIEKTNRVKSFIKGEQEEGRSFEQLALRPSYVN